jgi:hypothetical protein
MSTLGKSLTAQLEQETVKVEDIVVYKGKLYQVNQKICMVLFIVLMPFSILITLSLPSPSVTRRKNKDLYWGLILCSCFMILFSIIIVWIEDGLFLHFKYPAVLLGFALNAMLITGPHLLHNLATLNPDVPYFRFTSEYSTFTHTSSNSPSSGSAVSWESRGFLTWLSSHQLEFLQAMSSRSTPASSHSCVMNSSRSSSST